MITPIILFLVGLVLLIKGGDWFVDGATGIAHKFHVPDLLIGATVVSIGTTLPEVMVSATSAVNGLHHLRADGPQRDGLRKRHRFHHLQYGADRGNFHRSQAVPRG